MANGYWSLQNHCMIVLAVIALTAGPCLAFPGRVHGAVVIVGPADQTDCKGNTVEFSVEVTGAVGTISYMWQRKRPWDPSFWDVDTLGTSASLVVHNIGVGDEAPDGTRYRVKVTDDSGTYYSDAATLHVNRITGISPVGKANYTLCRGASVTWTVLTAGTTPISYQWIKHLSPGIWEDIPGATNATFSIFNADAAADGEYKVRVEFPTVNGETCIETSTIQRNIFMNLVDPGIIAGNQAICLGGDPAVLTEIAAASGKGTLSYQWQSSLAGCLSGFSDIPDATGTTFDPPAGLEVTIHYRRVVASTLNDVTCSSVSNCISTTMVPPLATSAIYHR